jgi:hypothetical protein
VAGIMARLQAVHADRVLSFPSGAVEPPSSMVERPKRTGSPLDRWRHSRSASLAISAAKAPFAGGSAKKRGR